MNIPGVTEDRVVMSVSDGIADIRMNRADKRNALDNAMFTSLAAAGDYVKQLDDVRAVAVTQGPGLIGALLVGVAAAKALAWSRRLPLIPVDHLLGHVARHRGEGRRRGDRVEHQRRRQRLVARRARELVRDHVDQHLGVAGGVDVAPIVLEQINLQLLGIGKVTVVRQRDTEGCIHIKRLRFFLAG